jgi:hypothetical protein
LSRDATGVIGMALLVVSLVIYPLVGGGLDRGAGRHPRVDSGHPRST